MLLGGSPLQILPFPNSIILVQILLPCTSTIPSSPSSVASSLRSSYLVFNASLTGSPFPGFFLVFLLVVCFLKRKDRVDHFETALLFFLSQTSSGSHLLCLLPSRGTVPPRFFFWVCDLPRSSRYAFLSSSDGEIQNGDDESEARLFSVQSRTTLCSPGLVRLGP